MTRKAQVEHLTTAPAQRKRTLIAAPGARQTGEGRQFCLPIPIAAFGPQGRLGQLSAINRHNQQLFDYPGGAQQEEMSRRLLKKEGRRCSP